MVVDEEEETQVTLTHTQASMVATALFDGFVDAKRSLCCGKRTIAACAAIVGKRRAAWLRDWCYERLGCNDTSDEMAQHFLDKIAALVKDKS